MVGSVTGQRYGIHNSQNKTAAKKTRWSGNGRLWRAVILIVILLLFTLGMLRYQNGGAYFDEGVYVSMARAIATGGAEGYSEHFRPPLLPLVLSPFMTIPANPFIVMRGCMFMLSLVCVLAMYWVGRQRFGEEAGLWTAFLFSTSSLVLTYAGIALVNLYAATLAAMALSRALDRRPLAAGILAGLCILTRFSGVIVTAFVGIVLLIHHRRLQTAGKYAAGVALPLAPYLLYNAIVYEGPLLTRMLRPFIDGLFAFGATSVFYSASSIWLYALVLLPGALALVGTVLAIAYYQQRTGTLEYLALGAVFLAFYTFGIRHFEERFALEAFVPWLVLGGAGIKGLAMRAGRFRHSVVAVLILAFLIIAAMRTPQTVEHDPAIAQALREHGGIVITNTGVAAIYAHEPELITGKNPDLAILRHIDSRTSLLVIDPGLFYECADDDCARRRDQTIARMSETLGAREGMLHGRRVLLFGHANAPTSSPEIVVRMRMVHVQDDAITREKEIAAFLTTIGKREAYLVLDATTGNLSPESVLFLKTQRIALAVEEQSETGITQFLEQMTAEGVTVATASAYEDSWPHGMTFPSTITRCFSGAWEEHATSVPCERIDVYLVENWTTRTLKSRDALEQELAARAYFDDRILVDVPLALVPASGLATAAEVLRAVS